MAANNDGRAGGAAPAAGSERAGRTIPVGGCGGNRGRASRCPHCGRGPRAVPPLREAEALVALAELRRLANGSGEVRLEPGRGWWGTLHRVLTGRDPHPRHAPGSACPVRRALADLADLGAVTFPADRQGDGSLLVRLRPPAAETGVRP